MVKLKFMTMTQMNIELLIWIKKELIMIKKIILCLLMLTFITPAFAEYVNGYYKSNGTYVRGYNRTSADSTKFNNYSTKGNYNPYTQQKGYVNPYNNYNNYNSSYSNSGYRRRY